MERVIITTSVRNCDASLALTYVIIPRDYYIFLLQQQKCMWEGLSISLKFEPLKFLSFAPIIVFCLVIAIYKHL